MLSQQASIKGKNIRKHQDFMTHYDNELKQQQKFTYAADDDLDHFNNSDTRTFKQRFIVNNTYAQTITRTTPLIVFMGGEGDLPNYALNEHYSVSYFAEQLNGLMVAVEHRDYGQSWTNTTLSDDDMQYLSSRQAIQDMATIISYVKQFYGLSDANKVIISGGSYTGYMSHMVRNQIAHYVDFSLASSGPNLAKVEYPEYMEHFNTQFQYIAGDVEGCYENMTTAIKYLVGLVDQTNADGTFNLTEFQQFTGMDASLIPDTLTWKDIAGLEGAVYGDLVGTMQYYKMPNYDGQGYEGDLQILCNTFFENLATYADQEDVQNIAKAYISTFPDFIQEDFTYNSLIECLQDMTNEQQCGNSRSWTWQTCTEFGYFQNVDDNLKNVYGNYNNISYSYAYCYDGFFSKYYTETDNNTYPITEELVNNYIDYTNSYYGALNQQRSNVFITAGSVCPWSELQLLENRTWQENGQFAGANTKLETLVNRSHCTDMYLSWTSNDDVRAEQLQAMHDWLNI